jgi:hypothetical protein
MIKVNLFDINFAHSFKEDGFDTASMGRKPTKIEWVRNNMEYDGVTIFTDNLIFDPIVDRVKSKYKIAWCQESPGIKPFVYENIVKYEDKFDYILTFHPDLLMRNSKKYIPILCASSRVSDIDAKIYNKTKNISIIASDKQYTTGHKFRHEVIRHLEGIDLWGSGYKQFSSKLDPLRDYFYSIAIMNHKIDNYFTEILVDCFRLGTIPIFWGASNIGDFFNLDGIIIFNTIEDLQKIKVSRKDYESRKKAIQDNFERSKLFVSTDDLVADSLNFIISKYEDIKKVS